MGTWGFCVLALLLPSAVCGQARTFTVPFHSVNGMILLDATLNGKPATFLLDTGANNSIVDRQSAGFGDLRLDKLRSTGSAGAEGDCIVREVRPRNP